MKILHFYGENLAGIKAGPKLDKIEIDFNKSNSIYNLLLGNNGKGKTVTLSLLQPLRGTNDNREPVFEGEKACKFIDIQNNKDIYSIKHYWKPNKSYIAKNGKELNENGNIRSFNEIIKKELNIDEEFFRIGRLGTNVSSLVEMTSGERKDYMSKFVPYIDDYLNYFKIVKDKYSMLNKEMTSIAKEMEKFPEVDVLREEKANYKKSLDKSEKALIKINKNIEVGRYKLTSKIEELKEIIPDDFNIDDYNDLVDNYNSSVETIEDILNTHPSIQKFSEEEYEDKLNKYKNNLTKLNGEYELFNSEITNLKKNKNEYYSRKENLSAMIRDIDDRKKEISNLEEEIKELKKTIKADQKALKELNVSDKSVFDIDLMDFNVIRNNFNKVISNIEEMFSLFNPTEVYEEYLRIDNINKDIKKLNKNIIESEESLDEIEKNLDYIEKNKGSIDKLKATNGCQNTSCGLISDALEFKKNYYDRKKDFEKEREELKEKLKFYNDELDRISELKENFSSLYNIYESFLYLFTHVYKDYSKADEFREYNLSDFVKNVCNSVSTAKEVLDLDYLYKAIFYNKNIETNSNLLDNKNNAYDSLKKALNNFDDIQKEINEIDESIESINKELNEKDDEEFSLAKKINSEKNKINIMSKLVDLVNRRNEDEVKINSYEEIIDSVEELEQLKKDLKVLDKENEAELAEAEEDKKLYTDKYEEATKNLSYLEKLLEKKANIDENYSNLKLVKDALDPKKGIPLIFIDKFLDSIRYRTNELLSLAYGNSFQIDFDITDKNFFIKVIKPLGDTLDDISKASQGEKAMTILSLSLAMMETNIGTNSYNILYLDEIDGALSNSNRKIFLDMLDKQIERLDIEQVFIITHNNEFENYPINLLLFDGNEINQEDEDYMRDKTVLFDVEEYRKHI